MHVVLLVLQHDEMSLVRLRANNPPSVI